jgi:hypothetical protein
LSDDHEAAAREPDRERASVFSTPALEDLREEAIVALRETLQAEIKKRVQVKCKECGHTNRATIAVPVPKARLDAARFLVEQLAGRAAPKGASEDVGDTVVFFRNVYLSGSALEPLLCELAQAVLADAYGAAPGKARKIAQRVYQSCGRFARGGEEVSDHLGTTERRLSGSSR